MSKIAIFHFGPLELYPPIQNLIRLLESKNDGKKIYVFTTRTNIDILKEFNSDSEKIKIIHLGISGQKLGKVKRYSSYIFFYLGSLAYCIVKKPTTILYYETISSYPAYLYKRFLNSKARLFIHYHEYTSLTEYANGMLLSRYFSLCEKYLYQRAEWVSHTNECRMQKFIKDISPIKVLNPKIVPNYPPASWFKIPKQKNTLPIKAVYVGALSMNTMYIKEFVEWVLAQNGKIELHIYSYNITTDTKIFLKSLQSEQIIIVKSGVNYDELSLILKQYDVGVILYKGHIENYIYNAPNKLFEYLANGLDVWFPNNMKGSLPYVTNKVYPKVISIDFTKLNKLILDEVLNKEGYVISSNFYSSEQALAPIADALLINT